MRLPQRQIRAIGQKAIPFQPVAVFKLGLTGELVFAIARSSAVPPGDKVAPTRVHSPEWLAEVATDPDLLGSNTDIIPFTIPVGGISRVGIGGRGDGNCSPILVTSIAIMTTGESPSVRTLVTLPRGELYAALASLAGLRVAIGRS